MLFIPEEVFSLCSLEDSMQFPFLCILWKRQQMIKDPQGCTYLLQGQATWHQLSELWAQFVGCTRPDNAACETAAAAVAAAPPFVSENLQYLSNNTISALSQVSTDQISFNFCFIYYSLIHTDLSNALYAPFKSMKKKSKSNSNWKWN